MVICCSSPEIQLGRFGGESEVSLRQILNRPAALAAINISGRLRRTAQLGRRLPPFHEASGGRPGPSPVAMTATPSRSAHRWRCGGHLSLLGIATWSKLSGQVGRTAVELGRLCDWATRTAQKTAQDGRVATIVSHRAPREVPSWMRLGRPDRK